MELYDPQNSSLDEFDNGVCESNVESISAWTTSMFVVELPEHDVLKDDLLPYAYQVRQSADSAIASQVAVS